MQDFGYNLQHNENIRKKVTTPFEESEKNEKGERNQGHHHLVHGKDLMIKEIEVNKENLRKLIDKYQTIVEPNLRTVDDFKEVAEIIKQLPWFQALGRFYNDADALELAQNSKLKFIDYNKVVHRPGDKDPNYYFIIRGKVGVGYLANETDRDFFLTQANALQRQLIKKTNAGIEDVLSQGSRALSNRSARSARSRKEARNKVKEEYIGGMKVRHYVDELVEEIVDGEITFKKVKRPHPVYQRVKEMKDYIDLLLDETIQEKWQKEQRKCMLFNTQQRISSLTQAEIDYEEKYNKIAIPDKNDKMNEVLFFENKQSSFKDLLQKNNSVTVNKRRVRARGKADERRASACGIKVVELKATNLNLSNPPSQTPDSSPLESSQESVQKHKPRITLIRPSVRMGPVFSLFGVPLDQNTFKFNELNSVKEAAVSDEIASPFLTQKPSFGQSGKGSKMFSVITPSTFPNAIAEEAHTENFTLAALQSPTKAQLPNIIPADSEDSDFISSSSISDKSSSKIASSRFTEIIKSQNSLQPPQTTLSSSSSSSTSSNLQLDVVNQQIHDADQSDYQPSQYTGQSDEDRTDEITELMSKTTINDEQMNIETGENGKLKYLILFDFEQGYGFGETSLLSELREPPQRQAYVHTLKPTHFLTIEKRAYRGMLKNHQKRYQKQMLNLLREVHILNELPNAQLKKGQPFFKPMDKDPKALDFLYKERGEANFVYLIVKGNFLVTKKIIKGVSTDLLFDENFDSQSYKVQVSNSELSLNPLTMKDKLSKKIERWQLVQIGELKFLGEDDVLFGTKYMTSVQCLSPDAKLFQISRKDFDWWIKSHSLVETMFKKTAEEKRIKYKLFIEHKKMVNLQNDNNTSQNLQKEQENKQKQIQNDFRSTLSTQYSSSTLRQFSKQKICLESIQEQITITNQRTQKLKMLENPQKQQGEIKTKSKVKFSLLGSSASFIKSETLKENGIINLVTQKGFNINSQTPMSKLLFTSTQKAYQTIQKPDLLQSKTLGLIKRAQDDPKTTQKNFNSTKQISFQAQSNAFSARTNANQQMQTPETRSQVVKSQSQQAITYNPVTDGSPDSIKLQKLEEIGRLLPQSLQYTHGVKKIEQLKKTKNLCLKTHKMHPQVPQKYENEALKFKNELKQQREMLEQALQKPKAKKDFKMPETFLKQVQSEFKVQGSCKEVSSEMKQYASIVPDVKIKSESLRSALSVRDYQQELMDLGVITQQPQSKQDVKRMLRKLDFETAALLGKVEKTIPSEGRSQRAQQLLRQQLKNNQAQKRMTGKDAVPQSIQRWRGQIESVSALSRQITETSAGIKYNHAKNATYGGIGHGQSHQYSSANKNPLAQLSNAKIAQLFKHTIGDGKKRNKTLDSDIMGILDFGLKNLV